MTTLDLLDAFLGRYRRFAADRHGKRLSEFEDGFQRIAGALGHLQALAREESRYTAADFNIFRLLGVARAEVTTHSAMLAELLNPDGSHGQGDRFLR